MKHRTTKWLSAVLSVCLVLTLLVGVLPPHVRTSAASVDLIPDGVDDFDPFTVDTVVPTYTAGSTTGTTLENIYRSQTQNNGYVIADPTDATNKVLRLTGKNGKLYIHLPGLQSALATAKDAGLTSLDFTLQMRVYGTNLYGSSHANAAHDNIRPALTKIGFDSTTGKAISIVYGKATTGGSDEDPKKVSAEATWETLTFACNVTNIATAISYGTNALQIRLASQAQAVYLLDSLSLTGNVPGTAYSITFNTNGGSEVPVCKGEEGDAVTLPVAPTKAGYSFDGWYTDAALTTPYTIDTFPAANMTLYAKWSEKQWTQGFETLVDKESIIGTARGTTTETVTIEAPAAGTSGHTGQKVMHFSADKTLAWKHTGVVLNGGGDRSKLSTIVQPGEAIEVSFRYKVISGNAEVAIYTGQDWNNESSLKSSEGIPDIRLKLKANTAAQDANGWQTMTQTYTISDAIAADKLNAIGFKIANDSSSKAAELYIDDVIVRAPSDLVKVSFDTNGGSALSPVLGETGTKIIYPAAPTKDGYVFDGWYTDAACTTLYTGSVYPTANTTLYAKWSEGMWTQTFETFVDSADGVITEPTGPNDAFKVIQSDEAISGKQVLHYKNDTGVAWKYAGVVVNAGGDRSALNTMMQPGDGIEVTFRYKVTSGTAEMAVQVGPDWKNASAARATTGIADNRTKLSYKEAEADAKGWQTFKGVYILDSELEASKLKALALKIGNTSTTTTAELYIDDVTVRPRTDFVTITYQPNGGDAIASMRGVPGAALTLPTATGKEDYIFRGWFTDAELKNGFAQSVYPDTDTALYAKWLEAGQWEQDFEAYNATNNNHVSGFELYEATGANDPLVHSGKYSMHRKTVANSWLVLFPGLPKVEQGKAYELEFWVYNKVTKSSALSLTYLHEERNSAWRPDDSDASDESARRTFNIYSIASSDKKDEWIKVNVRFTAEYSMYLGVYTYGELNDWYWDDIKLTEIKPGVATVDTENTYAEDLYNELTVDPYQTALTTKSNTLQTLPLQLRGNEMYIFAGAAKAKGSYAYLSWDDKGQNPIEPTMVNGDRIGYELMTDITGMVYLNVMNTAGADAFDEMVLVRSKLSYATQPPRASGAKISAKDLMSLSDLLKTPRYADIVAEMELDDEDTALEESPATGDHSPVAAVLLLLLSALVGILVVTKKRGGICE